MNLIKAAVELGKLMKSGKKFYIKFQPEMLDFTDPDFDGKILIYSENLGKLFPINSNNLISLICLLKETIFTEGITLICWNIKNFFSYHRFITGIDLEVSCKLFDLKIISAFLSKKEKKPPEDFKQAMTCCSSLMGDSLWPKALNMYINIHLPLITRVVPAMETCGVGHVVQRKLLYPYYEIEGQKGGRLNSHKIYKDFYLPHTMDAEMRSNLRGGVSHNDLFLYFDFANMEISMLQWLAQDDRLLEVLNLEEDFYKVIFKLATGMDCDTESKREFGKNAFIQTIYGQGAGSLASNNKIAVSTAEKIIDKFYKLFPKSFNWLAKHRVDVNGFCYDYFGRRRSFTEGFYYTIRNFLIQAPASTVCLQKFISFYDALNKQCKLMCHIHDGFIVITNSLNLERVISQGKVILEGDNPLCPGLRLKVNCKYGPTLLELKDL